MRGVLNNAVALLVGGALVSMGASGGGGDEQAVERLFTHNFAQHWRAGEAEALASLWKEDGDWMNLTGSRRAWVGRESVAGVWQVGLQGRETPWHRALDVVVDGVRRLGEDVFQVDLDMTFGSAATGRVREAMLATVERSGDRWLVASARVARISSEPASLAPAPPIRELEPAWTIGPESFCEPETVVWDGARRVYIVSNVCGFEANGRGFLSRLSEAGEVLDTRWVEGLDAPVGMVVDGDSLWVVDFKLMRELSLEDGRQLSTVEFPEDARAPNDVAKRGGSLFVTDSFRRAVYRIENGVATTSIVDDRLRWANGIHVSDGRLWVGGETLRELDLESGRIGPPLGPVEVTDIDGIESDRNGHLILSLVGGPLVRLASDGSVERFAAGGLSSANLLYRSDVDLAVVPEGTPRGIVAFHLP